MADTLRDAILEHHARHPDRLYVRCVAPDGSDEAITYRTLAGRGSQFAAVYTSLGSNPGAIVIIILPHCADLYCAFFGAVLGGQIPSILAVPSFKLNAEHWQHELEALLNRIDARVLVTDTATASHLTLTDGRVGRASVVLADRLEHAPAPIPHVQTAPADIVLLQHSSGSTGLKKGVALSNRSVLNQVEDYAPTLHLQDADRIASWLPLYHDMGLIACAVLPVVFGVPVSAVSPFHWVTRPASLLRVIHDDRCTLAWMPNFAYEFMATRVRDSQTEGVRLDSMRGWINCAEPTLAQSHRDFLRRFGPLGVRPETLWTCYAMAETTFAASQSSDRTPPRIERLDREGFLASREARLAPSADAPAIETMSGGLVLPGTQVKIVDDERRSLPDRRIGEIAIRSRSLFSGYFKDPASTSKVLEDGWYYSGDLGYLAEGHLFITGRKKDIIIIGGRNYYPQDIERIVSSVTGIYPGRTVALGLDDPSIGTQRLIVLAEVQEAGLENDADVAARVRMAVSEQLDCAIDDLRLVPHMWLLKTSSGKIARAPNLQRYLKELVGPTKHTQPSA